MFAAFAIGAATLTDTEQAAAELAIETITAELGVARESIEISAVRAVDWRDSSFGCPKPGKAYLDWVAALAKGDVAALRTMMGESAQWQLPEGDEASVKSSLESLRYSTLASATVSGGWLKGDRAILKVEGKDGDGNTQREIHPLLP